MSRLLEGLASDLKDEQRGIEFELVVRARLRRLASETASAWREEVRGPAVLGTGVGSDRQTEGVRGRLRAIVSVRCAKWAFRLRVA